MELMDGSKSVATLEYIQRTIPMLYSNRRPCFGSRGIASRIHEINDIK